MGVLWMLGTRYTSCEFGMMADRVHPYFAFHAFPFIESMWDFSGNLSGKMGIGQTFLLSRARQRPFKRKTPVAILIPWRVHRIHQRAMGHRDAFALPVSAMYSPIRISK